MAFRFTDDTGAFGNFGMHYMAFQGSDPRVGANFDVKIARNLAQECLFQDEVFAELWMHCNRPATAAETAEVERLAAENAATMTGAGVPDGAAPQMNVTCSDGVIGRKVQMVGFLRRVL